MKADARNRRGSVFVYVSGAGSCVRVPGIIEALIAHDVDVFSVLTPNVSQVTDPERLMAVDGNQWIRDYGHSPLDRFPFGVQLVAPCTFNTLNKIVYGLADNLAVSMIGDALGAGCPMLVALGMNAGQWANPRAQASCATLREWGVEVLAPEVDGVRLTLARESAIVDRTLAMLGDRSGV